MKPITITIIEGYDVAIWDIIFFDGNRIVCSRSYDSSELALNAAKKFIESFVKEENTITDINIINGKLDRSCLLNIALIDNDLI